MDARKVYIETYGCQMNIADTELLVGLLKPHGYEPTRQADEADVILLNTCAIRERAEERVLKRLADLVHHKTRRPEVRLGLTGCMAQHHRDQLLDKAPFLDLVLGPDAYRNLPALLDQDDPADPLVSVRLDRDETYADVSPVRAEGVRAWVTVMRGCDKFCTFCIVPYVRGRERSVPVETLLGQVRDVAAQGYKEVVYLGQTVNAYHHDGCDFGALLRRTAAIDGIERIRFTSPHPSDMTDSTIEAMADCPKVAPYLHLPLQSASNRVLARMERGYTIEAYTALMERLRAAVPDLAFSTDIIVGFPGEDEDDFQATCDFMRAVEYDSAFMFKYSARQGTKAYKWEETLSEVGRDAVGRRKRPALLSGQQQIIRLQEGISGALNQRQVFRPQRRIVLVEGFAGKTPEGLAGRKEPAVQRGVRVDTSMCPVFPANGARPGD